jgi:hypothetical protein
LVEVEIVGEIAEDRNVLADVGSGVGSAVGLRVEGLPLRKSSSMNFR